MEFLRQVRYGIAELRGALKFFIFYSKFALHIDKQVLKNRWIKINVDHG